MNSHEEYKTPLNPIQSQVAHQVFSLPRTQTYPITLNVSPPPHPILSRTRIGHALAADSLPALPCTPSPAHLPSHIQSDPGGEIVPSSFKRI